MVSASEFKNRYPHFQGHPNSLIEELIADAKLEIPAKRWGELRDRGIKLLVAHWLTLDSYTASELAGGLAEISDQKQPSFDGKPSSVEATRYGREFQRLKKSLLSTIGVRMI